MNLFQPFDPTSVNRSEKFEYIKVRLTSSLETRVMDRELKHEGWAAIVTLLFVALLTGILSWAEVIRLYSTAGRVAAFTVAMVTVLFLVGALLSGYLWRVVWGVSHYLFALQDGTIMWTRKDPRRFENWTHFATATDIKGHIIRVRNGGVVFKALYTLFRWRPYNQVFSARNPEPLMYLAFTSSVYAATLVHGSYRFGSCAADQLLEVRGFLAFFVERFEAEKLLRKTRAGLQAMSLYLTEVPDRTKRSKPGQWINASISCLAKETEADLSKVPASEVQAMQEKFLAAQAEPVA